ncbi:hypothetical protein BD626DRAFT_99741 [Schizophyllum amplum]|uniref:Uncharacterized protein n=1 Tax=Schizophyllum amplum TaxID=97359 RepID=A0A550CRC7_9AGAR|nr:hypothetical protein BD626DRAFT_99741 [Auriculariopsis ampla]
MAKKISTRTLSYGLTTAHLPAYPSTRIFHPRAPLKRTRSLTDIRALRPHQSAPPSATAARSTHPDSAHGGEFNVYTHTCVSNLLTLPFFQIFLVHSFRHLFISRTEYVDVADRSEGRGRAVNARARPPCSCKVQQIHSLMPLPELCKSGKQLHAMLNLRQEMHRCCIDDTQQGELHAAVRARHPRSTRPTICSGMTSSPRGSGPGGKAT